jgi:hypothetical protein
MTGLVGIFAHDVPKAQLVGTKKVLTPALTTEKERERMAEEMRWGFRHYVTPAELVAFNRKHPLHKADPPMPREYILDEFHETIIARRVDEEALGMRVEEERGGYPEKIERAVEARQIEHWDALRIRSNVFDPDWD